jgi:hypothetical protein
MLPLTIFPEHVFGSKKAANVCRKKKYGHVELQELRVSLNVPVNEPGTLRSLAGHLGVSIGSAFKLLQEERFKVSSSSLKPSLIPENEYECFLFCIGKIDPTTLDSRTYNKVFSESFVDQLNKVYCTVCSVRHKK